MSETLLRLFDIFGNAMTFGTGPRLRFKRKMSIQDLLKGKKPKREIQKAQKP